jgi:acyl carrier protein
MLEATEAEIHQFIVETFLFGRPDERLGVEDSLIARRVIDSTGILEVAAFLESRYGVAVADEEMLPANFDSIRGLAGFVARKRQAG